MQVQLGPQLLIGEQELADEQLQAAALRFERMERLLRLAEVGDGMDCGFRHRTPFRMRLREG
jgi:hypothetical protein